MTMVSELKNSGYPAARDLRTGALKDIESMIEKLERVKEMCECLHDKAERGETERDKVVAFTTLGEAYGVAHEINRKVDYLVATTGADCLPSKTESEVE